MCADMAYTRKQKKNIPVNIVLCVCVKCIFKRVPYCSRGLAEIFAMRTIGTTWTCRYSKMNAFFIGDIQLEVFSFSVPMNASTSAVPKAAVKLSPMAKCDHGTFRSHNQWLLYNQSHSDHQHVLQAGIHSMYFRLVFSTNEVSWQKKIKWICDRHSWILQGVWRSGSFQLVLLPS